MSNEELVILIQSGQETADNMLQLWQQNKRLISMIAKKYAGYAEQEDLEQEGYLALKHAAEKYDSSMQVPFVNYAAQWIHCGMRRYIENCGAVVRIPVHEQQKCREYKRAANAFCSIYGRKPTQYEIARYMELSPKQIEEIEKSIRMMRLKSMDELVASEDDECTLGELVGSTEDIEADVLDRVEQEELKAVLWSAVDTLPGQQPEVIRMKYQQGKTLKAIGAKIGISYQRVHQLEYMAMREMRKSQRAKHLLPFLPEELGSTAYNCSGAGRFKRTFTSSTELAVFRLLEDI